MADKKSSPNERTRNWTVVLYPESAPSDWRDYLDEQHIEWIESPLHEFDTDPTGEIKKPHYHIALLFGGVKSYEQVLSFVEPLKCPIPKRVHNIKALVRYMAHLDNPDKYQYGLEGIICHGGVEIDELLKPSSSERYSLIAEMMQYVDDSGLTEMQDLLAYARNERFNDWFPLLCDNCSFVMNTYVKSQRHRNEGKKR